MTSTSENSVVKVYVDGELQASGVVIDKDKIVTCLHVINPSFQHKPYNEFDADENPSKLKIEIESGDRKYPAQIVRGNQHHDLCLLQTVGLGALSIPVAPSSYSPQENEKVFSIGLPDGAIENGFGRITKLEKLNSSEPSLIFNDAPTRGGCSGGALLNSDNKLIGIQSLPHASIPAVWIHELLLRHDRKIISRSHVPETELDYYFEAISRAFDYQSSPIASIKWVLERPESVLAATSFLSHVRSFSPELADSREDYEKVMEILEMHAPQNPGARLAWLKKIIYVLSPEYQEKFLIQALAATQEREEQAGFCSELGRYYFYYAKNPQQAIAFYERTASIMEGTGDALRTMRYDAYTHLSNLYLSAGDKEKAHQALLNAFEMRCRENTEYRDDYFHEGAFELTLKDIEDKKTGPLFSGEFEKEEMFRTCMRHVQKVLPKTELGGSP